MYLSNNIDYNMLYVIRLKDETIFFKYISTKIIFFIIFNFINIFFIYL